MDLRFEVGDTAWWAQPHSEETSIECPDCGGTGRLRVILHDDEEVSVACANCSWGYHPPTGRIKCYDRTPHAEVITIQGFEFREGKIKWQTDKSYIIDDDNLFEDKADAVKACATIAEERDKAERDKILTKEKDHRSWAWNASYHRSEIKGHNRQIEYHTACLNVANLKLRK